MANSSSSAGDAFDLRKIRRLVELMNDHDLSEIDLQQGDLRVRLRRRGDMPAMPPVAGVPAVAPVAAAPAASQASETSGEGGGKGDESAADEAHIHLITSPMVGTFYSAGSPDAPPYVKVGDHVGADTTVCIVEAMKVFNEIPAGVSGKIVAVLVENGEPVEYGQPLFKVDTRN